MDISQLNKLHDRSHFYCGKEALDIYLKKFARQDMQKHMAAVFVLHCNQNKVWGYYTLSATRIDMSDLPENISNKLPHYPSAPAILLGRLAIDRSHQGQGYGELLLIDAMKRCIHSEIASMAMVVDAKDNSAIRFYSRYGFQSFPDQPYRLFVPIKTILQLALV